MCKLLMVPYIPEGKAAEAWAFVRAAHGAQIRNDRDGYGYAALHRSGRMFAERWFEGERAFETETGPAPHIRNILQSYGKALAPAPVHEQIGEIPSGPDDIVAIITHARRANTTRMLRNTHPFVCGAGDYQKGPDGRIFGTSIAMIHNGCINNDTQLTRMFSSCDSEVIMHQYLEAGVSENPENFQAAADSLDGHYALGFIVQRNSGGWIVDIVRDDHAMLSAAWIRELGAVVFCTTEEIMDTATRTLGWQAPTYFEVRKNFLIRHDPFTGNVIAQVQFIPSRRRPPADIRSAA